MTLRRLRDFAEIVASDSRHGFLPACHTENHGRWRPLSSAAEIRGGPGLEPGKTGTPAAAEKETGRVSQRDKHTNKRWGFNPT